MPLTHVPSLARGRVTPLVRPAGPGRCQTRPVRSDAMPLHALDDSGQPVRVLEGGPSRASCAECGAPMRARTGSIRIWHWRTWCTTRAARRPGQPNGTWPGRCWPGRAVALRGIELVHSLGRRPSREHGRHHALWDWGHRNARNSADLDGWRLLSDRQPRRADRVVPCSSIARICRIAGVEPGRLYAQECIIFHDSGQFAYVVAAIAAQPFHIDA